MLDIYVPDYYDRFECIKDKCRHSCCIGWEIDIDEDTLSFYKSVDGDFGKRLCENISLKCTPHFKLTKDERCPFLNDSNLCDIYIHCGKEHLCEICSNHPRYVNVFCNREEWGLGMCCEAAAHIILSNTSCVKMSCKDKAEEQKEQIIKIREGILSVVQDRKRDIRDRLNCLMKDNKADNSFDDFEYWREVFGSLEVLDDDWSKVLMVDLIADYSWLDSDVYQIAVEQLAVYFVLRYINKQNEKDIRQWISFCCLGVYMITELFSRMENKDMESFVELCRMYSSEIEYSLDNIDEIIMELI